MAKGRLFDPDVIMLDLWENKPQQFTSYIFYHIGIKKIVHTLTFEQGRNCYV